MTRPDGRTDLSRPGTRTTLALTLAVLLVALVGLAAGTRGSLLVAGTTALVAGGCALVRGRAGWLRPLSRRTGALVAVAGVLVVGVGAAFAPAPPTPAAEGTALAGTPAPPSSAAPAAPRPAMGMTCPAGAGASPRFGQQITAVAPYRVAIDYGDGDRYTNDDQHLGAVFSHTYAAPGSWTVTAELTDATAQTVTATCTYTWSGR